MRTPSCSSVCCLVLCVRSLGFYATFVLILLLPTTLLAMGSAFGNMSLTELVINLYLFILSTLLLLIEMRVECTRRTAIHILRCGAPLAARAPLLR
jgi:hypothetical protein